MLTSRMSSPDYESRLVTGVEAPHEGNMLDLADREGVEPIVLPLLGREISPLRDLRTVRELKAVIAEFKPHIVHTHTAKAGFLGRWAAHSAKVPVIVHTFHGNVLTGYFGTAKTALFRFIEKRSSRYTDAVIAISKSQKAELAALKVCDESKIEIVRLGFELEPFAVMAQPKQAVAASKRIRAELGIPMAVPVVGIAARLTTIKRIDRFIRAAAQVRDTAPDAHFLIVGDGELRAELEQLTAELGLTEHVIFTGWRKDMPELYAAMDVVALTSDNEGTPVTLIEAMAAGKAVVSTDVGGGKDLIEDGLSGRIVANGDELAETALALLSDKQERDRLGREACEFVSAQYSFTRLRSDIDALYKRLLQDKAVRI